MFSIQLKRIIATKVQSVLQGIAHDELPDGEIQFILHVDGAESWSWANIRNNGNCDVPVPDAVLPSAVNVIVYVVGSAVSGISNETSNVFVNPVITFSSSELVEYHELEIPLTFITTPYSV